MVEIRWVLVQGDRRIELLTSLAEFRRMVDHVARERDAVNRVVVTIGLSLRGVDVAEADEGTTRILGQLWDSGEWVVYQDEPR